MYFQLAYRFTALEMKNTHFHNIIIKIVVRTCNTTVQKVSEKVNDCSVTYNCKCIL